MRQWIRCEGELIKSEFRGIKNQKTSKKTSICGHDTNRIMHVKERFFHSFTLFNKVELSERQAKTERM